MLLLLRVGLLLALAGIIRHNQAPAGLSKPPTITTAPLNKARLVLRRASWPYVFALLFSQRLGVPKSDYFYLARSRKRKHKRGGMVAFKVSSPPPSLLRDRNTPLLPPMLLLELLFEVEVHVLLSCVLCCCCCLCTCAAWAWASRRLV